MRSACCLGGGISSVVYGRRGGRSGFQRALGYRGQGPVAPRAGAVGGAGTPGLKGKFVGAPGGQIDDIPKISISGGELRFVFEKRYQRDQRGLQKGMYWARLEDGKLKGTFEIAGDPSSYLEWTGMRAPVLPEKDDPSLKK